MKAILRKWGNSVALRLPREILAPARLEAGQEVEVSAKPGQVLIESASRQPEYALDNLVAGITKKNLHEPADFGIRAGKEQL